MAGPASIAPSCAFAAPRRRAGVRGAARALLALAFSAGALIALAAGANAAGPLEPLGDLPVVGDVELLDPALAADPEPVANHVSIEPIAAEVAAEPIVVQTEVALEPVAATVSIEPIAVSTQAVVDTAQPVVTAVVGVDTVGPVVETVVPVVETVVPVVETIAPVVETITPVIDAVAPVVESIAPVVHAVRPVVEPITPVVETIVGAASAALTPAASAIHAVTPVPRPATASVGAPVEIPAAPAQGSIAPTIVAVQPVSTAVRHEPGDMLPSPAGPIEQPGPMNAMPLLGSSELLELDGPAGLVTPAAGAVVVTGPLQLRTQTAPARMGLSVVLIPSEAPDDPLTAWAGLPTVAPANTVAPDRAPPPAPTPIPAGASGLAVHSAAGFGLLTLALALLCASLLPRAGSRRRLRFAMDEWRPGAFIEPLALPG